MRGMAFGERKGLVTDMRYKSFLGMFYEYNIK